MLLDLQLKASNSSKRVSLFKTRTDLAFNMKRI